MLQRSIKEASAWAMPSWRWPRPLDTDEEVFMRVLKTAVAWPDTSLTGWSENT
jgi:hypothetical protein